MDTKTATVLDVEINMDIITGESCSEMLQTIIQTLLFQRSQIPFYYQMFLARVNQMKEKGKTEESKWGKYQLSKQRKLAIKSLDELETLFRVSDDKILFDFDLIIFHNFYVAGPFSYYRE